MSLRSGAPGGGPGPEAEPLPPDPPSGPGAAGWIGAPAGRLSAWALVLDAEHIPYQVARGEGGWGFLVRAADAERAARELAAFEGENPRAVTEEAGEPGRWPAVAAGLVSLALLAAFAVTGPGGWPTVWDAVGAADAGRILDGELWRAVTALTLHADFGHVLSNALAGAFFFGLVFRDLGPGAGLLAVVAAGAGGNLLNALLQGPGHRAIGASTAVFGAVGLLPGLQLARERRLRARPGRLWAPVLAGLVLLGLFGTGPDTDILAHLFGFVAGVPLGFVVGVLGRRRPGPLGQAALGLVALASVALAWWAAIG